MVPMGLSFLFESLPSPLSSPPESFFELEVPVSSPEEVPEWESVPDPESGFFEKKERTPTECYSWLLIKIWDFPSPLGEGALLKRSPRG